MSIVVVEVEPDDVDSFAPDRVQLPLLAVPTASRSGPAGGRRVLVGVEGQDTAMARQLIRLLNPESATLELVHVTWLPAIAASPIAEEGLDNPVASDLLMFEGAKEALIDRAEELRAAGFALTTHLRLNRHPAEALGRHMNTGPSLVVLGLGRHGAGIGRDLLAVGNAPVLFVDARAS